jgi:hypothetical protein
MSDSARPLGPLILMIVGVLVALAIFWIGFMLAPAAVLLISYLALSAGERGRHQRQGDTSPLELASASTDTSAHRTGEGDRQGAWVEGRRGEAVGDRSNGELEDRRDGPTGAPHPVGNEPRGVRA